MFYPLSLPPPLSPRTQNGESEGERKEKNKKEMEAIDRHLIFRAVQAIAQTCQKEGGLSVYSDHSRQNPLVAYILPYPRGGGLTQVSTQATIIKHSTLQISIQLSQIHFPIPLHPNKLSIPAFPRPPAASLGWKKKRKWPLRSSHPSERVRIAFV